MKKGTAQARSYTWFITCSERLCAPKQVSIMSVIVVVIVMVVIIMIVVMIVIIVDCIIGIMQFYV